MRKDYKLPKHVRNYIIQELYDYKSNKKRLIELQNDILFASNSPDGQPRGNMTSDPTAQKAEKLITSKSVLIVTEKINNVERALERLNEADKDVVDIIFFKKRNQAQAETQYGISYATYYGIRDKMIYLTAIEYGEV